MRDFSPIAIFAYKRPHHFLQCLDALATNPEARESDVFIFCDGPVGSEDREAVSRVRLAASQAQGFKTKHLIFRERHIGLEKNITTGVSEVLTHYKTIIVIEDDLVVAPRFLSFMNNALRYYEDDERVMHIAGWNYPIETEGLEDCFLWPTMNCWGWATWSRAWRHYERQPRKLIEMFSKSDILKFNIGGSYPFWSQVKQNDREIIRTWAVFWYASIFLQGGLCLNPSRSLVKNIGRDGSGTHCGNSKITEPELAPLEPRIQTSIVSNELAIKRIKEYLDSQKISHFQQVCKKLKSFLRF